MFIYLHLYMNVNCQLKNHMIESSHLSEVEEDTVWEDRNIFLKSIAKKN